MAVWLAGCVATPHVDSTPPDSVELVDVPFFPQTDYQCGPAALATILAHDGVPVDADDLAPAVYVEGLRGSLQAELLAATRRHARIAYRIEPTAEALFAELEAGRPVLVLQNLGLPRFPVWHYAVVVGYDAERGRVLLRSGTERRRSEPLRRFLRSWARAEQWAFVAVGPTEPPATAAPARWIRALADAERLLPAPTADAAYDAAIERWPQHELVLFAAAGRDAAAARWDAARARYERVVELAPEHAAARNNLANVLAERGCLAAALTHAQAALELVTPGSPLRPAIEDTVRSLAGAADADADAADAVEPAHCTA